MENKIIILLSLSLFVLALFAGVATAALDVQPDSLSLNDFSSSKTITMQNTGTTAVTVSLTEQTLTDNDGKNVVIKFNVTSLTIGVGETATVNASVKSIDSDFMIGTYEKNYVIGDSTNNDTLKISFTKSFCDYSNEGELKVTIDDMQVVSKDNLRSYGEDNEWLPLDKVELTVIVENDGNSDVQDVEIVWGLYDKDSQKWAIEPNEEDDFDIDEGDEETVIINFELNEKTLDVDFDELGDNYVLVVKATGQIDDSDSDHDEEYTCASDSEDVEMIIEKNFVIVSSISVPETTSCGSEIVINGEAWNIGDKDQENVYAVVRATTLGLKDSTIELGDLDAFENKKFQFNLNVPTNLEEGTYKILLEVYDEDDEVYENKYNEDEAVATISLKLSGECEKTSSEETVNTASAVISADLESAAKAGEDLIVKTTITNTGKKTTTYTLSLSGYSDWATLENTEQGVVVLAAGQSEDILLNFKVNSDAEGDKAFEVEAISGGKSVITQPVAVYIEEKASSISSIKNLFSFSNANWYLWAIGAINVVLILAIIVVALRIAKK